jgi:hypothetical protein
MEDVPEVYHRPYDPDRPVVCADEATKQLIGETRVPVPAAPDRVGRFDFEYVRLGTANLFMALEPLLGWRGVQVTGRRAATDFAELLRWLAEDVYPEAERIVPVVDNLNTSKPAVLYEAVPPVRARRIAAKFEWHYTPKHGSWLNTAEVELSALGRQCLARRIESMATLRERANQAPSTLSVIPDELDH